MMDRSADINLIHNFFGQFSVRTWLHLKLVKNGMFRLNETTITQNLVKDFWIESKLHKFPIKIYESNNEKVNGSDLEILIETAYGYIMLPVQVKVIKEDEKYSGISHGVRGTQQIDLLIDYADKKQGIPAYIFYNYYSDYEFEEYVANKFPQYSIEEFGCTIGSALNIKKAFFERGGLNRWQVPSFEDIHMPARFAIPLHFAFCKLINGDTENVSWFMGKEHKMRKVRYYSSLELTKDEFWSDWFPPGRISGISDTPLMGDPMEDVIRDSRKIKGVNRIVSDQTNWFSPQYRIVISKNRAATGIRRIS